MSSSGEYIANINKVLKDIKSNVLADFAQSDYWGLITTMNKIVSLSDISIIKKYIKNINTIILCCLVYSNPNPISRL